MKYIERLKAEYPEYVSDEFIGGCEGCPEDYGYEPYRNACPSGSNQLSVEEACRRCWRREMPAGKKPDWRQDMLRKFDRRVVNESRTDKERNETRQRESL